MTVRFREGDASVLWCIPKEGGDIACTLHLLVLVERIAPPSFEHFVDCMTNALQAGIVEIIGNEFRVTDDWYATIHAADDVSDVPSLEFQKILLANEWNTEHELLYDFNEHTYDSVVEAVIRLLR